jgi:hypothetical protein
MKNQILMTTKLLKHLQQQAKEYRQQWKEELTESEDIEDYGLNEFIGGKAEVYEEVAEQLKNILENNL